MHPASNGSFGQNSMVRGLPPPNFLLPARACNGSETFRFDTYDEAHTTAGGSRSIRCSGPFFNGKLMNVKKVRVLRGPKCTGLAIL